MSGGNIGGSSWNSQNGSKLKSMWTGYSKSIIYQNNGSKIIIALPSNGKGWWSGMVKKLGSLDIHVNRNDMKRMRL